MRRWIGFEHGVNLGGWLSQCDYSKDRLEHFIVEEDIKRISDWPVDHVRLPIDYNVLQDQDGTFIESGFEYVRKAIHWCRKYGLNIILDLHKTAGYSFDQGEKEAGFLTIASTGKCFTACGRRWLNGMQNTEIMLLLNC